MASILVEHWRKLTGTVHPTDAATFASHQHTFNLDFPPPAYIGDIENAPVVLLDANGGYDPIITPKEFAVPDSQQRYRHMLHNPAPINPALVAPYYSRRNYSDLIADGTLALVNAIAYRSRP